MSRASLLRSCPIHSPPHQGRRGDLLPGDVPTHSLRCDKCDRHLGYLHHRVSDELRTRVEGRAPCPILRDTGLLR
jgi:hypothetical protein